MKKMLKLLVLFGILLVFFSCRNEADNRPRIEKIEFETENKTFIEGDTVKITVMAQPTEAKKRDKIKYWTSDNSLIELMPESNNDYVVFKGLKAGQGIIKASVNGMDIFCDVTVISSNGTLIPYIVVSDYVIESERGQTLQIIASLIGGYPQDNNDFVWEFTGQDKNVINLTANNNVVVIETVNIGDSIVTVYHKKALYGVNTLVFVREKGEIPVYITTSSNVINMNTRGGIKEYSVDLFGKNIKGAEKNNYHLFRHDIINVNDEIMKESSVIELQYKNNVGTIKPKAKGIAKIRVSHQDADYPIDIVVIVNEAVDFKYIDTEDTVIIMEEGEFKMVRANIIGDVPDDSNDMFEYVNENDNVITINNSQNIMSIKAVNKGKSVITIKNKYVNFDKEILVIVNGQDSVIDQERYITTNQNVITTEVNATATLTMTLVGGNSADANNFVWTVEDGSIIEMVEQHGSVNYKNRAAAVNTQEKFEATALIRAKKIGTTTITLENPKAKNTFQVVVKVYKQNVLGVVPVVINGASTYKIEAGKEINVFLSVVTGFEKNFTNVRWESSNKSVFTVEGNTALTGVLKGRGNGIATLTVAGDNLKGEFSAVIIVGDNDYFDKKPYIYVNNPFMTLIKGNTVSFKVNCVNLLPEDMNNLNVVNNAGDKLEVFSYRNNVTVKGISFGEGDIIISGEGLNTLKVTVMVENYALTPEMPYYLRAEKYIYGMVKGNSIEIQVDLVGGIAVSEKNIGWEIYDENVASIKGNGKKCIITGKNEGQTVLKASHYQAQNKEVEIVIYVVLSDAELKSKVVVSVLEQNILLRQGETRFISVITNAADGQNDFRWGNGNANVIGLRVNGDKKSAFIDALTLGNATITVGYGNQVSFVIYISVISETLNLPYINVPSIVEMIAGQNITVNAVTSNVNSIYEMTWFSQDENIAKTYGNGDKCTVTAFKSGKTVIEVRYPGFVKDIVLRVYDNADEMAGAYVFSGEQTRYVINKGDIVNIGLVFGMKGYPEHDLPNIRWTTGDGTKIDLKGNGKTASVQGLVAGFWKVRVADNYGNDIEIEIAIKEEGKAGRYSFSIDSKDRIKGMVAGTDVIIPVKVVNNEGNEVYNVSGIEYTVENSDIISVEKKEGGLKVYAKPEKEGQSYITITHDLAEDGKILIYTSLTEGGLAAAYPIMVEKTNYMVTKGDTFNIKVNTIDENSSKLANINYRLEKDNGVLSIQECNKKEIAINAEKEGSEIILVYYNANVVQRIYVSVMEKGLGMNAGYMVTENIIGLVIGQEYETRVDTDIDWGIEWESGDTDICEVEKNFFDFEDEIYLERRQVVLKAKSIGETYIKVKNGSMERHILVFVVDNPQKLNVYKAINIEQRDYKISKGMSITVNIHSYQGKVEGETKFNDYFRYSVLYGNVIKVNEEVNNKISIKGINEGIAAIRITNSFYNFDEVVYIEVYPVAKGDVGIITQGHYITAEKTLYILSSEKREQYIQVGVLPSINFYGDSYWEWTGYDENIISVEAMGRGAIVKGIKEGETKIKVQNQKCEGNGIEITVIVGERYIVESGETPYIYAAKDVFEMIKGSGNLKVPYSIINTVNIELKNITFNVSGSGIKVAHDVENGEFIVEAVNTGIARFEIIYGSLRKDIYVLVKENLDYGNIYFTTSENFVIASIGELRNININLVGYDEIDASMIEWSVSNESPRNVVQLVGNGLIGQIYGVAEGSIVVNITHKRTGEYKAVYPLSINVKIVKDRSKENVVYLTTNRNVIETVEGSTTEMIYIQKVGGDPVKNRIDWTVESTGIISLEHTGGMSARLFVHKEGTAKIKATNIEAAYELSIVVIVRKSTGSNVYIESDSNLIWLSPGTENHLVKVNLVNGEEKDFNLIKWSIDTQLPTEYYPNAGSEVINIIYSNEQCYINAVNEGTAYIRVECTSKADLPLIITVYVSNYREVKFGATHKEVVKGEMEIVVLELPNYERLKDKAKVWAVDINGNEIDVVRSTGVINVYYTNSIVLIQGLKKGNAVIRAAVDGKEGYAEMTVSVVENHSPDVNRIVVGKNMYVVSDSSEPFAITANVTGPNMNDGDLDNIQWEITNNYADNDTKKEKPLIEIFPQYVSTTKSKGRTVQITPKNIGNAVIKVWHEKVTQGYYKEIYVVVAKDDNKFNIIEKGPIEVKISEEAKTISVYIVGGTNKDYEQVRWLTQMQPKWDGTLVEVVRIMGSGKEVMLFPINDGETTVYAFYNGVSRDIKVRCISDYYFNVTNINQLMHPTEIRDIEFEVRPASNNVRWMYTPPDNGAVIGWNEIQGSAPGGNGTVTHKLRITALKEGTATVIGIPSQGKPATINIEVKDDYEFLIEGKKTGSFVACNFRNPAPKHTTYYAGGGINAEKSSTGIVTMNYQIYPGNYLIKPTIPSAVSNDLLIDVSVPEPQNFDSFGRQIYGGTITFTGLAELSAFVTFDLYKPNLSGGDPQMINSSTAKPTTKTVKVMYYYDKAEVYPVFVRGDGKYSNTSNFDDHSFATVTDMERSIGTQYKLKRNEQSVAGAENIVYVGEDVDNKYMILGDGEQHYLFFDKDYENQKMVITEMYLDTSPGENVAVGGDELVLYDEQNGYQNIKFTARFQNLIVNGETYQGVVLSGGEDYIEYNRVAFDKDLIVGMKTKYSNIQYKAQYSNNNPPPNDPITDRYSSSESTYYYNVFKGQVVNPQYNSNYDSSTYPYLATLENIKERKKGDRYNGFPDGRKRDYHFDVNFWETGTGDYKYTWVDYLNIKNMGNNHGFLPDVKYYESFEYNTQYVERNVYREQWPGTSRHSPKNMSLFMIDGDWDYYTNGRTEPAQTLQTVSGRYYTSNGSTIPPTTEHPQGSNYSTQPYDIAVQQDFPRYNAGISGYVESPININSMPSWYDFPYISPIRLTLDRSTINPTMYNKNIIEYYENILPVMNIFASSNDDNNKAAKIYSYNNMGNNDWGRKIRAGINHAHTNVENGFGSGQNFYIYLTGAYVQFALLYAQYYQSGITPQTPLVTTAPYDILNCYPFRYKHMSKKPIETNVKYDHRVERERKEFQVVYIEDVARPMPTTNRGTESVINGKTYIKDIVLVIVYNRFNAQSESVEPDSKRIPIKCVVRPSHFQYFGLNHDDDVKYDNRDEISSATISNFGNLIGKQKEIYAPYMKEEVVQP